MKLTYRIGEASSSLISALITQATHVGVQLEVLESAAADLYFHQTQEKLPQRTGISHLLGTEALSNETARILLAWAKERQELLKVSPARHELGNLIVILQGRIMRLRQDGIDDEHLTSLQNLQERLTVLYKVFDCIVIPNGGNLTDGE